MSLERCFVCEEPLDEPSMLVTRYGERAHRRCQRAYWRGHSDALRSNAPDPLYFDAIGGPAYPASRSLVSVSAEVRPRPYGAGRELIIRVSREVLAGVGIEKVREWLARQR